MWYKEVTIKMKLKEISIIALISFLVVVGILLTTQEKLPVFKDSLMISCPEGKYDIPKELNSRIKLMGLDMTHMSIIQTDDICNANLHYKEPQLILGTLREKRLYAICNMDCINTGMLSNELSSDAVLTICCSFK